MNAQYVKLSMIPSGVMPTLYVSQYDVGRPLGLIVTNGTELVDMDSYSVTIEATRSDGTQITAAVTTADNIGTFQTTATMTNVAGIYKAQLVIAIASGKRIASIPFLMNVTAAAMDENGQGIAEDQSLYQQYTGTVQTLIATIRADLNTEITNRQSAVSAEAAARQTADNTLQSNINSEASTRAATDQNLQAQISQIVAPSGEAPSAAEVQNARVGADGVTYPTLGEAIRANDSQLKSQLDGIGNAISPVVEYPEQYYTFSPGYIQTGNINIGDVINITPIIPSSGTRSYIITDCVPGDKFHLDSVHGYSGLRAWAFIDSENKLLANSSDGTISGTITAPENASKVIFNDVKDTKGTVYKVGGTDGFNALVTRVTNAETAIEANTNSIKEIATSNKNLWTGDASQTFIKNKTVTLTEPIPAGTYTLSATVTSSDTDTAYSRFQINSSSITGDLTRNSRNSKTFTTAAAITSITFFAGRNSTGSTGDTATWADIQIESGSTMTSYVPHQMTSKDDVARDAISKLVKYVATTGADTNDGDTPSAPYATIGKAISEGAKTIYIKKGTYTENTIPENTAYRYRGVRIIADDAVLVPSGVGLQFRFANVEISGLTVDVSESSNSASYGFLLLNCTGTLNDCTVIGAKDAGGFRLDGSELTLTRCEVSQCDVDGFNGHTVTSGYETEVTLIDCIAHDCGDDGASIHENGKMYVYGGEYYNNAQTGLAPHDTTAFEVFNVHCHHNGKGIEAVKDTLAEGETPAVGRVIGCILNDNTTYGLDVKNYTVNTLANGYANNGTAPTRTQTGGTINAFSVT